MAGSTAHINRRSSSRLRPPPKKVAPLCLHCGTEARLVSGKVIYQDRLDLVSKLYWKCPACPDSYCGCHPNTDVPLGRPASRNTRKMRMAVHKKLDPLWMLPGLSRTKRRALRKSVYRKLAEALGIAEDDCHTAFFDLGACGRAIEFLDSLEKAPQ